MPRPPALNEDLYHMYFDEGRDDQDILAADKIKPVHPIADYQMIPNPN